MSDIELKPCPFCKSTNVSVNILIWRVSCHNCHSIGPVGETQSDAIAAWNKRAESPTVIEKSLEDLWESLFLNTPNTWSEREELPTCGGDVDLMVPISLQVDKLNTEINRLQNYAANLRIAMRKARKVLKAIETEGVSVSDVRAARRILNDALKEEPKTE